MANILILGGGFAGLVAAERLASSFESGHQITLVSRSRQFIFYPALVRVAFGASEPDDIAIDLIGKMNRLGIRFVEGDVVRIDSENHNVEITGDDFNGWISYDYLIIAFGRRLATEKIGGFFENSHHILGVSAALKLRESIEKFNSGHAIIGMCPDARLPVPVCETAFALARRFERQIDDGKVTVKVLFPESLEQAFGGAKIHRHLEWAFEKHRIKLLTNFRVSEISEKQITGECGQTINHDLLMLVPPFRGQSPASRLSEISDGQGFIKINSLMQVEGLAQTYAAGDIASFSGPKMAHMAVRQARVAADNIISEIIGETPRSEYYHEINTVIDSGDSDALHLHYGIWDDQVFELQTASFWNWAKRIHERLWRLAHS